MPGRAQMPKADVVDVPAIGEGLCVSNLFQTNMVLQRDEPIAVWGWAAPGEEVTVAFGGAQQTVTADPERRWRATLPAMPVLALENAACGRGVVAEPLYPVVEFREASTSPAWFTKKARSP